MKNPLRTLAAATCITVLMTAATPRNHTRLTPARIAELVVPAKAIADFTYSVEMTGLDVPGTSAEPRTRRSEEIPVTSVRIPPGKTEALLESIREYRYPTEFDPPEASVENPSAIVPTTPRAFETTNTGWTVRLNIRPSGKLIAVAGVADYTSCEMLDGGRPALGADLYREGRSPFAKRSQTAKVPNHQYSLPHLRDSR